MTDEAHQARVEAIAELLYYRGWASREAAQNGANEILSVDPATAQLKSWQQMVESTNQTNAAMGRRLQEQEDKLTADTARIMELKDQLAQERADADMWQRHYDATVDQLSDLQQRYDLLLHNTANDTVGLAEAKEALLSHHVMAIKKAPLYWANNPLRIQTEKALNRLEGNDERS